VARQAAQGGKAFLASECPLAGVHVRQGIERLGGDKPPPEIELLAHPIELVARAYRLGGDDSQESTRTA